VLDEIAASNAPRARFSVTPRPLRALPDAGRLLAGAAEVDITPPPGLPKAGYSRNAHDGNGFRTRLHARVLHLRAGSASIAIVHCDLLGGSSVLQHLVADAIADRTDIPLAGLMIGATHTHAGPGQFLGTDFYNRFASNRAGFDPAWAAFLVDQIAGAVVAAHDTRAPARLAIGRAPVYGLTRNRSLDPHVHNATVADKREEPQRKFTSVNPDLHVVRVDTAAGRPLFAGVIFSVHGTGISQHTREYNADVWGYLADEVGTRVERALGSRPVVGTIEGTHADVAPAIRPGLAGHLEAARIGRGIGAHAAECYADLGEALSDDVALAFGFTEIDLEREHSIDGIELPRRAAVGAALVAGATENVTPVVASLPPFRAGRPKRLYHPSNPQGPKWVLGSRWLQPIILPGRAFPRVLPLQLLRIGTTNIVGLPFEITVESGRRIAAAVGPNTIVSSVANEYSGYVTTPEEYTRQYYEGGHTIYGPNTLPFLAAHARRLARAVDARTQVSEPLRGRTFDLKVHRYVPEPAGARVQRRFATRAQFVDPTKVEDGYWAIEWVDVPPGDLQWHRPLVEVVDEHEQVVADDAYGAIDVTYVGEVGGDHRYRARWFDPMAHAEIAHRFVLCENGGQPRLISDSFD
jgi:neutral ceramidase